MPRLSDRFDGELPLRFMAAEIAHLSVFHQVELRRIGFGVLMVGFSNPK